MIVEQTTICPEHRQPLNAFCEECSEVICRDCYMSAKHNTHQFRIALVNECYQRHLEELKNGLGVVKEMVAGMSTAVEGLVAMEGKVAKQEEDMRKGIEQHAQQIIDMIQASKDTLLDQMRTTAREKKELLAKQREEAERVLSQLKESEALVETNLKDFSHQAVLKEKQVMLERMKTATHRVDPTVFQPIEKANMVFVKNTTLLHDQQEIGKFLSKKFDRAVLESSNLIVNSESTLALDFYSRDDLPFPILPSTVSCEILANNVKPVECDVQQVTEGKYSVGFTPSCRQHQLKLQVGGIEIPGSPFTIPAKPTPKMRGEPVKTITGLSRPWGVAVCDNGDIVVAENEAHCVTILNKKGESVKSFGTRGVTGEFQYPRGVALTRDGHVLVLDEHRLQKLTVEGVCVKSIGKRTAGNGNKQLSSPHAIAVHPTTGQIFVTDCGNYRIQVFNDDLGYSHTIDWYRRSLSTKEAFREPHGIGFDSDNNLYVSEYGNHCITKLTTKGQYLASFGSEGSDPGQLFGPSNLTTDGNYIYVTELGIDRVSIFDTKGSFVHCFWNRGEENDSSSHGIAIDQSGNLYVSDGYTNILVY